MKSRQQHRSNPAKSGPARDPAPGPARPRPPAWRVWLLVIGVLLTLSLFARPATMPGTARTRHYAFTTFVNQVDANQVKTAAIDPNGHVSGQLTNGDRYTSQVPTAIPDTQLAGQLQAHQVQVTGTSGGGGSALGVILNLLPLLLLVGFFVWMGRRSRALAGGITGIGRAKSRVYELDDRPATRFGDVAGYEGTKEEVTEVVDFLKHPEKYRTAGAVGPRGVLMVGPPGTGKTLLARAVAGEAAVPFLALTGSSFVEMFVGVGAARVRDLSTAARSTVSSPATATAPPSLARHRRHIPTGQRRGNPFEENPALSPHFPVPVGQPGESHRRPPSTTRPTRSGRPLSRRRKSLERAR